MSVDLALLILAGIASTSPVISDGCDARELVADHCPTCVTGQGDVATRSVVRQRPATFAVARQEDRPDAWLAEDKLKHFTVSFGATAFGYGAATLAGLDHGTGVGAAVGVAAALGIAKEFRDRRLGGPFSARDLVWDAAGIALGLLLVDSTR